MVAASIIAFKIVALRNEKGSYNAKSRKAV